VASCGHGNVPDLDPLLTADLDWERVVESAEHHRLIPALHAALSGRDQSPPALRIRAHKYAWRVLHFTTELAKIARQFEYRRVQFVAHKGPALAQLLYRNSAMRQFADLDLLVAPEEVPAARAALIELGYQPGLPLSPRQEKSFLHSGYEHTFGLRTDPNLVELQWQIVPRFCSVNLDMHALLSRSVPIELDGLRLKTLAPNDLMLVLCVHAAKHEWSQLGMLRDIATLAQFDLDWNWIVAEARRLGILKILQISLLAASELLSVELPIAVQPIRGADEIVSKILVRLQCNYESQTECLEYFRSQLQTRERWRDRAQFVWRLATTASVQEWQAVRIPDRFFVLYGGVRIARLLKKLLGRKKTI
jgi:hypothetical protein